VILSAIATSIMTVVSIVFAILLMSLTLASTQFSPRILVSFVRDRATQWTIPGGPLAAGRVRAGGLRDRRDAAVAGRCRLADLLHPSHFAGNQRQSSSIASRARPRWSLTS
jgi:hypothetical protein